MTGKVLVTGGSGYIAGFLIQQLIAEGWIVHATIRNLAREAEVRRWLGASDDQLRFFAADLTHDAGWASAVAGCSHVAHVASPLATRRIKHPDELVVPARDGVLRALRFARDAGVRRVVMTSSVGAIAYGHPANRTTFTERDWTNLDDPDLPPYQRSKTVAERAARAWVVAEADAPELVTVNPTLVLGPVLAADSMGSVEVVRRLLSGDAPGLPPIGFGVVDVRDVADLHVRALTASGIGGERLIASGPYLTVAEIGQILRERLGPQARKVPTRRVPGWLLRFIALFDPMVRGITAEIGQIRDAPADHAQALLGWIPRPVTETITDTARSLIDRGLVKV